jgi:hypothetical protein
MIVHNFIIVLDTEDLVINRDNDNFNERNRKRRPSILRKATRIASPPKRHIICKNLYEKDRTDQISTSSRGNIDNFNNGLIPNNSNNNSIIDNKNNNNNFLLDNSLQSNNINDKVNNASLPEQNNIDYKKNNEKKEKGLRSIIKKEKKVKKENNNKKASFDVRKRKTINLDDKKIQEKIDDIDNRPIEKQNFNFCKYILYLIQFRNKEHKIFYYENFRAKLISEENIIQSYLDIYKLLESFKLFKSKDKNSSIS